MKYLLISIALCFAWHYFRTRKTKSTFKRPVFTKKNTDNKSITLVQCDYCKTYIPENEAIKSNGKAWCDHNHQHLGSR